MPIVSSPGGGGGGLTAIATQSGTGASGTLTFSAIDQSFNHLYLILMGRGDQAAAATNYALTFNGVGGTSYDSNYFTFDGSTTGFNPVFGAASFATAGTVTAATATANYVGLYELFIPFYSSTTFFKIFRGEALYESSAANAGINRRMEVGTFKATAAISSLAVSLSSGNFLVGTTAKLYGYN